MTDIARKNVRILEISEILFHTLFYIPVLILFYENQIGLTFGDFLLTEAIFAAVIILLEVPSGWLSDIWKRKYVLALSYVFWIAGAFAIYFADGLFMAIVCQALYGVSISLKSGTDSALLYDTLLASGQKDDYTKLEGRIKGYGLYSVAGASLVGGFFYQIDPYLPVLMTIGTTAIGLILVMFLTEPERQKTVMQHNPVTDIISTIRYTLHGHADVGMIILFSAMLFSATKLIMWMQQPYYIALDIPAAMFGVLMACGYFLGGFASHINHMVEKVLSNFSSALAGWTLAFLACVLSAILMNYAGIAVLMFGASFVFGAIFPRMNNAINQRVSSDRRATILSTASFLRELIFIPLSLIIGYVSSAQGVQGALLGVSVWLIIAGSALVYWGWLKRRSS